MSSIPILPSREEEVFSWDSSLYEINTCISNEYQEQTEITPEVPEIDLFEEEDQIPVLISSDPARSNHQRIRNEAITATTIIHTPAIPDWPKTSLDGVAYIIPTAGLPETVRKSHIKNVQYCTKTIGGPKHSTSALLESVPVLVHKYSCTGVKACNNLALELKNQAHTEVTEDYWLLWGRLKSQITQLNIERDAISWANAIQTDYQTGRACTQPNFCTPVISQRVIQDISGSYAFIVACCHYRYQNGHHFTPIPPRFQSAIRQIQHILLPPSERQPSHPQSDQDKCFVIDTTRRVKATCGITHIPNGQGTMERIPCSVILRAFIPIDPLAPYIIITSHGRHSHPPPPPSNPPRDIRDELQATLELQGHQPTTLDIWLRSDAIRGLLEGHNAASLAHIHPSLANKGWLQWLMTRHKALHFPLGVSRLGAYHEYLIHHRNNSNGYIRIFYDDGINLLIVLFHREQAEMFKDPNFTSFQLDMNFKHIRSATDHEVIWGNYNHQGRMGLPLLRAIINSQSAKAYEFMFSTVFRYLQEQLLIDIKWQHIHGEGIQGVTIDQDFACIRGLGHYLSKEADFAHRNWEQQVQQCVRLCHVHFDRGVEQTCNKLGNRERGIGSMHHKMKSLKTAESRSVYYQICHELKNEYPSLIPWVEHKELPLIAAGLNDACSYMTSRQRQACTSSTNHVEQLHEASYQASGRYGSLLKVILANQRFDADKISRLNISNRYGTRLSYNDTTVQGRMQRDNYRRRSRARGQSSQSRQSDRSRSPRSPRSPRTPISPRTPSQPSRITPQASSPLNPGRSVSVTSSGVPRGQSLLRQATAPSYSQEISNSTDQTLRLQLQVAQANLEVEQAKARVLELQLALRQSGN